MKLCSLSGASLYGNDSSHAATCASLIDLSHNGIFEYNIGTGMETPLDYSLYANNSFVWATHGNAAMDFNSNMRSEFMKSNGL